MYVYLTQLSWLDNSVFVYISKCNIYILMEIVYWFVNSAVYSSYKHLHGLFKNSLYVQLIFVQYKKLPSGGFVIIFT